MITLLINGIDQTHRLHRSSWGVDKQWAVEKFDFALFDPIESADAYRPAIGSTVHLTHDGDLVFGGMLVSITDSRIDAKEGVGVLSQCVARDWMFYAEQSYVPRQTFASQTALALFQTLFTRHLEPRGCTNLSLSTGGPVVPVIRIDKANTPLRDVLRDLGRETGWMFRINGDKEAGLVEPGSLLAPVDLDGTNAELTDDVVWTEESTLTANRLFYETGVPVTGAGPVDYEEELATDGTKTHFPVHVLPPEIEASIDQSAGYAAGVTTIALADLPVGWEITAGTAFIVEGSDTEYAVASDVTVDAEGKAAVSFTPSLAVAVVNSAFARFEPGAFIAIEVNGTPTAIDGVTWHFDPLDSVIYTTGAAPAAGTLLYRLAAVFPAMVRSWDPLTTDVQTSTGAWDFSVIVDGTEEGGRHTDLDLTIAHLDDVLQRRRFSPKLLTLTTRERGFYPLLMATCRFPARLIDDVFMVQSVQVRPTELDPHALPSTDPATRGELYYSITLIQGDRLDENETFIEYYRRAAAA